MTDPVKEEMDFLLRSILSHPDEIVSTLLEDWKQAERMKVGCRKVLENEDKLDNAENLKKQLITAVKLNQRLSEAVSRFAVLMLIYTSSADFKATVKVEAPRAVTDTVQFSVADVQIT